MDVSILIGIASFVIGVLSFLGIRIQHSAKISWRDIKRGFKRLEPYIRKYDPDIVIGLADGVVIAGIIATNLCFSRATNLCFSPYYTLGVTVTYDEKGIKTIKLLGKDVIGDLSGKRVLVVDDHIYTGATLKQVVDFLITKNPKEIKTLVLFNHEVEEKMCEPDYYAYEIKGKRRKVPWSYTKDHEAVYRT
jgi:hypoxanthine phosphoribosyltransferase